jgi:hypothetical protein
MPINIKVFAHKGVTAELNVTVPTADDRKAIEEAIEQTLRSDKELVWGDDPEGVNVDVVSGNKFWRPRRRFFPNGEGE